MGECYYTDPSTEIYLGNASDVLRSLPADSVNVVVTSPPYFGLRSYEGNQEVIWNGDGSCEHLWETTITVDKPTLGETSALRRGSTVSKIAKAVEVKGLYHTCSKCGAVKCSFGHESSSDEYVSRTIEILREIRRVLRPDGVVWWNIDDTYVTSQRSGGKPRDLCLVPFKIAHLAQYDGWFIRSIVIWEKVNPMPESLHGWYWEKHKKRIKGKTEYVDCPGCDRCNPNNGYVLKRGSWRPTEGHEYILMMTKSGKYYGDAEPIREPLSDSSIERAKYGWYGDTESPYYHQLGHLDTLGQRFSINGRNIRSIWRFPTESSRLSHYAAFPKELPRRCILSSISQKGYCPKCGAPWARIIEKGNVIACSKSSKYEDRDYGGNQGYYGDGEYVGITYRDIKSIGWRPTCKCGIDETKTGVVLDPFVGTGTTLVVAKELGLRSIGIDISEKYCEMSKERVEGISLPMKLW